MPGIVTDEQTASWRRVVEVVRARDGLIAMEIVHGERGPTRRQRRPPGLRPSALAIGEEDTRRRQGALPSLLNGGSVCRQPTGSRRELDQAEVHLAHKGEFSKSSSIIR
ncbi:hypothetical protein ACFUCQ_05320 [Streptomyces sp. NPDC057197]|uniref:hypothetical protein n=1 Tax=Streptomyces sp. NPDC057197 TaxID=3346045 RepID=UPI00363506F9